MYVYQFWLASSSRVGVSWELTILPILFLSLHSKLSSYFQFCLLEIHLSVGDYLLAHTHTSLHSNNLLIINEYPLFHLVNNSFLITNFDDSQLGTHIQ